MLPSRCYSAKAFKHIYIWLSFSQDNQNNNNNDSILLFDGLWIVKAYYMMQEDKLNIFYFT